MYTIGAKRQNKKEGKQKTTPSLNKNPWNLENQLKA